MSCFYAVVSQLFVICIGFGHIEVLILHLMECFCVCKSNPEKGIASLFLRKPTGLQYIKEMVDYLIIFQLVLLP